MANTNVKTRLSVLPTDTSTVDVTIPAETRSPTGVIVFVGHATALDTETADFGLGIGFSDFTLSVCGYSTDEDAQSVSDSSHQQLEGLILNVNTPGTQTSIRTATVAAITGGVRITPGEGGAAYRLLVVLIFGASCKAFAEGAGTLTANSFNVAHGLGTKPNFGFYTYNRADHGDGGAVDCNIGFGFHTDDGTIKQVSVTHFSNNGEAVNTSVTARVESDSVMCSNNPGSLNHTIAMTANDATNCTYLVTGNTANDLCGLLVLADDVTADCKIVDSPTTAASDWVYTGLSFTPQFVSMILTPMQSTDAHISTGDAGGISICCFDNASHLGSIGGRSQSKALGTTSAKSRFNQKLRHTDDGSDTALHEMNNPSVTSSGWTFAAADITTADSTVRKWPMLAIEVTPATASITIEVPVGPIR